MRTNKLQIYTGCMASGKSNELLRWYKFSPLNFDVYTFGKDGFITSRNTYYTKMKAFTIHHPMQILYELNGDSRVSNKNLILDECQFFTDWQLWQIEELYERYERIYLAGLDWLDIGLAFKKTQFFECVIQEGYKLPFGYSHTQLIAKNDITGINDARISMRFCDVGGEEADIIDKTNYFNVSYKQAFNSSDAVHKIKKSEFIRTLENQELYPTKKKRVKVI